MYDPSKHCDHDRSSLLCQSRFYSEYENIASRFDWKYGFVTYLEQINAIMLRYFCVWGGSMKKE